jgi:hypothetical protein
MATKEQFNQLPVWLKNQIISAQQSWNIELAKKLLNDAVSKPVTTPTPTKPVTTPTKPVTPVPVTTSTKPVTTPTPTKPVTTPTKPVTPVPVTTSTKPVTTNKPATPVKTVNVISEVDNPDWTTTVKYSDWTTSKWTYTKNPDWTYRFNEIVPPVTTPTPAWTINKEKLDSLLASWKSLTDIRNAIITKYWDNSSQLKQFDAQIKIPITTEHVTASWDTYTTTTNTKKNNPTYAKQIWAKDITTNINASLLNKTSEQITKDKISVLDSAKESDIEAKNKEFTNWAAVLNKNNQALLNLYWIDANWNVDENNINWIAYKTQKAQQDYAKTRNDLLKSYEWTRLNQVQWQIRSMLASRWIDVSAIPVEQLIALSGQIWANAFTDVYNAKEKTINEIEINKKDAENQINMLREKWVISTNEANANIEMLRAKTTADINAINKQFANDVFGIVEKSKTDKESKMAALINSVTQLWASLGLTWSALASLTTYINKYWDATSALTAMINDLNNPSSDLRKKVLSSEEAARLSAEFEASLKEREVAAKEQTSAASALRAEKSWSTSSEFKLTSEQKAMAAAASWLAIQDITPDVWNSLVQNNPAFRDALSKWTYTAPQNAWPTIPTAITKTNEKWQTYQIIKNTKKNIPKNKK